MAVETGLFDLYERENGQFRLTGASEKMLGKERKPVADYFATQSRFRGLDNEKIQALQTEVDEKWAAYEKIAQGIC
jgi:pyruvate ferredoxin oxidoreductase beta subunit